MKKVDKRECHLKSGTVEAVGFRRSVRSLQEQGVLLKEIVTDAHPQISFIVNMPFIDRYIRKLSKSSNNWTFSQLKAPQTILICTRFDDGHHQ